MTDLSFLAPGRLALLVLPAALAIAYLVAQRRRRRYALRFTTLDLLDEVAPDRPGWRRHVPALLLLAGAMVATLAVARPAVAEERSDTQRIVILAIDTSLSMQATDVSPSRISAARDAASEFLDTLPDGVAVGVVGFSGQARELITPTTNLDAVRRVINRASLGGGTAIGEAVFLGLDAIEASRTDESVADGVAPAGAIVLLSDGDTTEGRPNEEAAAEAASRGIAVTTIAFGTDAGTVTDPSTGEKIPVPVNEEALADLARTTGGQALQAETADELRQVYENLGQGITVEVGQREVADWFAAAALVLVLLAGTASLLWFGRLP